MAIRTIPIQLGSSIHEALKLIADDTSPVILQLEEGVYTEKVVVDRPNVTLRGRGKDKTRLSYSDAALTQQDGKPMGTFASASLQVASPNFKAEHLCIANDFDYPGYRHLVEQNPGKVKGLQAVAFRTMAEADNTQLFDCCFFGYQDTLLLDAGTHRLVDCVIEGNIDFIFGSGFALFEHCTILSSGPGYVLAPSTRAENLGFCFHRCSFLRKAGVEDGSVYLGRPWHPKADEGINSYALLYDCFEDSHIHFDGWTWMHAFPPEGGEVVFTAESSRFFESSCRGPGSKGQRHHLEENEAISVVEKFLFQR